MSTSHWQFTTRIEGPPEALFDLIADMPNYGRWLPGSSAFGATTEVSPYPVRLGTTYLDAGPAGRRPGSVTEFDPPRHLAFHQTMLLKRGPLAGNADVRIRYTFEPEAGATRVIRVLDLTVTILGLLKILEPVVALAFRSENARLLPQLKRYVDSQPSQSGYYPRSGRAPPEDDLGSEGQTMSIAARLTGVVLECPDPRALAEFYSQLTGWAIVNADSDWYAIGADGEARPRLSFQLAPGHQPPHWPDPGSSMQFHLDFTVDDLDSAEQSALALGARKFDEQPSPDNFRVLADPVGHPFCLCV